MNPSYTMPNATWQRVKNGLGRALLVLVISWGLSAAALAVPPEKPPAVAFVVGVEAYKKNDLDNLRYVGEDSIAVFKALRSVTDLKLEHSRILIAEKDSDEKLEASIGGATGTQIERQPELTRGFIWSELERFLATAKSLSDKTLVFIYFGGHGDFEDEGEDLTMSFLASNFEKGANGAFLHHLRLKVITDELKNKVRDKTVIVFMNTCHSGRGGIGASFNPGELVALQGEPGKEFEQDQNIFYYPASAPDQQTFEVDKLGGSLFARALTDALYGNAALEGEITTDSLARAIRHNLNTLYRKYKFQHLTPPAPVIKGKKMRVGVTTDLQSEEAGLLAIALAAEAAENPEHARMLYRLASLNFRNAAHLASNQPRKGEWYFAEAIALLAQLAAQTNQSEITTSNEILRIKKRAERALKSANKRLQNATLAHQYVPLQAEVRTVLENLSKGEQYVNVFLLSQPRARSARPITREDRIIGMIGEIFEKNTWSKPQETISVHLQALPGPNKLPSEVISRLKELTAPEKILNVVYSGNAGPIDLTYDEPPESWEDLAPVSSELLWLIARTWEGPVNILFDGPFGGIIKRNLPAELEQRVSLLLTAEQINGMTFKGAGPENDTTFALLEALKGGLSKDKLEKVYTVNNNFDLSDSSNWSNGKPAIVGPRRPPLWGVTNLQFPRRLGEHLKWWAYYWGATRTRLPIVADAATKKTAELLSEANEMALKGDWTKAVELLEKNAEDFKKASHPTFWCIMASFRKGILNELSDHRRHPNYSEYYKNLCADGDILPENFTPVEITMSGAGPSLVKAGNEASREFRGVGTYLRRLRNTLARFQGRTPKVYLITLAAENYISPNIPDLDGPNEDIDFLTELLASLPLLKDRLKRIALPNPKPDQTIADTVRETLRRTKADSWKGDLIVFIFSGRGVMLDGKPAIVPEDVAADILIGSPPEHSLCGPKNSAQCLRVEEIAEIAEERIAGETEGRSLVAIFDTQFQPVPGKSASLLDKYAFPAAQDIGAEELEFKKGQTKYKAYPLSESYPQSIMLWLEGRVPQRKIPGRGHSITAQMWWDSLVKLEWWMSVLESMSPEGESLFQSFEGISPDPLANPQTGAIKTYEDWLKRSTSFKPGWFFRAAGLGALGRPVFLGGNDVDELLRSARQEDRRDANLAAGVHLARERNKSDWRDDIVTKLSAASMFIVYARTLKDKASAQKPYKEAWDILEPISQQMVDREGDYDLYRDYLHWVVQIIDSGGTESDEAVSAIMDRQEMQKMNTEQAKAYVSHLIHVMRKASKSRASAKLEQGLKKVREIRERFGFDNELKSYFTEHMGILEKELSSLETPNDPYGTILP